MFGIKMHPNPHSKTFTQQSRCNFDSGRNLSLDRWCGTWKSTFLGGGVEGLSTIPSCPLVLRMYVEIIPVSIPSCRYMRSKALFFTIMRSWYEVVDVQSLIVASCSWFRSSNFYEMGSPTPEVDLEFTWVRSLHQSLEYVWWSKHNFSWFCLGRHPFCRPDVRPSPHSPWYSVAERLRIPTVSGHFMISKRKDARNMSICI